MKIIRRFTRIIAYFLAGAILLTVITGYSAANVVPPSGADMIVQTVNSIYLMTPPECRHMSLTNIVYNGDGTPANDLMWMTNKSDRRVEGKAGNDCVVAGTTAGKWTLKGDDGNDVIVGNNQIDEIDGGHGDDIIYGFGNNDIIDGGDGSDTIYGGDGDDNLKGGPGTWRDTIYGGNGNDVIDGENGDDVLYGGLGNDDIKGGDHNDQLYGEDGDDYLRGEQKDDLHNGGNGSDRCNDNNGVNTFISCEVLGRSAGSDLDRTPEEVDTFGGDGQPVPSRLPAGNPQENRLPWEP